MVSVRLSAHLLDCKSKESSASLCKHRTLVYLPTLLHYLQKTPTKAKQKTRHTNTKTLQNKTKQKLLEDVASNTRFNVIKDLI